MAYNDDKQDAKVMKGMNSTQKAAFKKGDSKMDAKKPSPKADAKMDKALGAKVKGMYMMKKAAPVKKTVKKKGK